jgi:hypothetical protein
MEKIFVIVGVVSFLAGMILMDALWAWKTGVMRAVWHRVRGR